MHKLKTYSSEKKVFFFNPQNAKLKETVTTVNQDVFPKYESTSHVLHSDRSMSPALIIAPQTLPFPATPSLKIFTLNPGLTEVWSNVSGVDTTLLW